MSTMAKTLSINISRIIGTASKTIAIGMEPCVKSRCELTKASRKIDQNELFSARAELLVELSNIQTVYFYLSKKDYKRGSTGAVCKKRADLSNVKGRSF